MTDEESRDVGVGEQALSALVAPLSFAAKNDFAGVGRLRGIEGLVTAAVEAARSDDKLDHRVLDGIERVVKGFDRLDEESRIRVLCRLAGLLARCIALPADLSSVLAGTADAAVSRVDYSPAPVEAKSIGDAPVEDGPDRGADEVVIASCQGEATTASGAAGARVVVPERPPTGVSVLDASLSSLTGIGPTRAEAFAARGVRRVQDAIWFLPVGYELRSRAERIADLIPGRRATVTGRVVSAGYRPLGRGRRVFDVLLSDSSGCLRARYYRPVAWLARKYREGAEICVSGPVRKARDAMLEMAHPDMLDANENEPPERDAAADSIVPRYGDVEGVPARTLRNVVGRALPHARLLPEPLPSRIVSKRGLIGLDEALRFLHKPPPGTSIEALEDNSTEAHRRLVYEELFFLQLGLALKARGVRVEPGIAFDVGNDDLVAARELLPFELTAAQQRVVLEIARDMARPEPMHRLLQGDVGSGKTAVAVVALALAARLGWQGAVMAPTELLAEQHYKTVSGFLELGGIEAVMLSGKMKSSERRAVLDSLATGEAVVVIGTHALIQEGVRFRRLGLVVVDEQHRFGVQQRARLIDKGRRPDTLVMTATPIPRTLAMTAYGDLDLSIIDELPPGRTPVTTKVFGEEQRGRVWDSVRRHVVKGRQAFVVYPIVETSEHLEDVKAASGMAEELGRDVFPDLNVALLHGRMAADTKDRVMDSFSKGEIHVLVATTVVEVGIDVPNATVMVVEHAERFGLSQLHQLRGRVGRGAERSYCYLVACDARGQKVRDRLSIMARTCDGFAIAEEDLRIRGPGEVLGTRQSGHPDLIFGNLARDRAILAQAREDAFALVDEDPFLREPSNRSAGQEVLTRWGGRIQVGRVG